MDNTEFAKLMLVLTPLGLAMLIVLCFLAWALGDIFLGAHACPLLPP